MTKRSYRQYCPVAHGLDVIGDRWTILIVRELSYGPRRFTDINGGLPGLGPNLLTQRFKELEEAGVLERRKLPPPAATRVYALTESGHELYETVIAPLSRWGMRYMPAAPSEIESCSVISTMKALEGLFNYNNTLGSRSSTEFHMGKDTFYAHIKASQIEVGLGFATDPGLIARLESRTLVDMLVRSIAPNQAVSRDQLDLEAGTPADMDHFLRHFGPPG